RSTSASANVGLRFSKGWAELNVLQAEGRNEYDGWSDRSDILQRVVGGQINLKATERWDSRLVAGRSWDESDDFAGGSFASRFATKRDTVSWLNDLALGNRIQLSLGADYQRDEVDSTTAYDQTTR